MLDKNGVGIYYNHITIREKCELLNKYFSFISSLEDANIHLPDIEHRTNNFLRDIVITTDEIVDIIKI
jgi:hypothetical protein